MRTCRVRSEGGERRVYRRGGRRGETQGTVWEGGRARLQGGVVGKAGGGEADCAGGASPRRGAGVVGQMDAVQSHTATPTTTRRHKTWWWWWAAARAWVCGSVRRCSALVAARRNTLASSTRCEGHSVSGRRRTTMKAQVQVHIPCGHRASMLMCRGEARFPCGCESPSR